jgi:hypothetical protein
LLRRKKKKKKKGKEKLPRLCLDGLFFFSSLSETFSSVFWSVSVSLVAASSFLPRLSSDFSFSLSLLSAFPFGFTGFWQVGDQNSNAESLPVFGETD